jgi:hypothetical protein
LPRKGAFERCDDGWITNSRKLSVVPIARYFTVVGSALTALLLIAAWVLPERQPNFSDWSDNTAKVVIRITSERKWPERIVFDTEQPTFTSPSVYMGPAPQLIEYQSDEAVYQASGEVKPNPVVPLIDAPRRPTRARRARMASLTRAARVHLHRDHLTLAKGGECCGLEWAAGPSVMSPKRARLAWPLD